MPYCVASWHRACLNGDRALVSVAFEAVGTHLLPDLSMPSAAPIALRRALILLCAGLAMAGMLSGCGGGKKLSATGASGELPDSEVEDFTVTETDSGRAQWTLFSKQAATFTAKDLVTARTVRIVFFDEKGARSSELVAREGELYQRTRDMIARG